MQDRYLFIHTAEDLVQSWKSQTWSPTALDCHNIANFTKPRAINTRWGYAPRKGMGFVFIHQCSSLTPFPPADMQTGLSRTAHAAEERKFVCVEIMKVINKPAQWFVTRGPSLLPSQKVPPSHRPYEAAVIILVKRFKLRVGETSGRARKEGLLGETGAGRSTS